MEAAILLKKLQSVNYILERFHSSTALFYEKNINANFCILSVTSQKYIMQSLLKGIY